MIAKFLLILALFGIFASCQPPQVKPQSSGFPEKKFGCPFIPCQSPCFKCQFSTGRCIPMINCPFCTRCRKVPHGGPFCFPEIKCSPCHTCKRINGEFRCVKKRCPFCYHCEVKFGRPICVRNFPFQFSASSGEPSSFSFKPPPCVVFSPQSSSLIPKDD